MTKSVEAPERSRKHAFGRKKIPSFSNLPVEVRHQFERLKSSIILESSAKRTKTILFSSYNHGEGTSTVVADFVECLAKDRKYKILAVDANTRAPGLQEILGGHAVQNSLVFSDLLAPEVAQLPIPTPSGDSNLLLVPGGSVTHHPSEIFDRERFSSFIDSVTKIFDFVVFDSSPIGKYYDPIVLASHVDGVVLVVQAQRTLFHELKRVEEQLRDRHIPVMGVVLNRRRFYIPNFVFQRFLG